MCFSGGGVECNACGSGVIIIKGTLKRDVAQCKRNKGCIIGGEELEVAKCYSAVLDDFLVSC